jgi:Transposase
MKIKEEKGISRKPGSGLKNKLNTNDKRRIIQIANKNKKMPANRIAAKATDFGTTKIKYRTIQRYLISIGWIKKIPSICPHLTMQMMQKRVKWCKYRQNVDWNKVVFSVNQYPNSIASHKNNGRSEKSVYKFLDIYLKPWSWVLCQVEVYRI